MIRSTGVALRMCALMSKVSYLLLLSFKNVTEVLCSISYNDYLNLNILCS